jgi:hypothetical protein
VKSTMMHTLSDYAHKRKGGGGEHLGEEGVDSLQAHRPVQRELPPPLRHLRETLSGSGRCRHKLRDPKIETPQIIKYQSPPGSSLLFDSVGDGTFDRCQADMAHIRDSRPESGLGFQEKA